MERQRQAVRNEEAPSHGHMARRKSAVWKNFDYDVASAMATCKRCGSTLKAVSGNGTSHLLRHAKSSICNTRAAERAAPCLPAAAPAGDGDDDDDGGMVEWKWINDVPIDANLFPVDEQLDSRTTPTDSPFIDGRQMYGGGEVAVAGDNNPRFPNSMPDTRLPQVPSSSSKRFSQRKRERSAYLASHQRGATDKDHSSRENTDWAAVENSVVYSDFIFGDAYD